jgi:hypothetical protein
MTKNPDPLKVEDKARGITVKDAGNAPIVFFDGAPNFGFNNGIVNVTLAAVKYLAQQEGVTKDIVAVTHLRCTISTAIELRKVLDDAVLLGRSACNGGRTN